MSSIVFKSAMTIGVVQSCVLFLGSVALMVDGGSRLFPALIAVGLVLANIVSFRIARVTGSNMVGAAVLWAPVFVVWLCVAELIT